VAPPEELDFKTWIWAAQNGFIELRDFVQKGCETDIYKVLRKDRGLEYLVETRQVPLEALRPLIQRAAKRMTRNKS
jgi:hypothetical protein